MTPLRSRTVSMLAVSAATALVLAAVGACSPVVPAPSSPAPSGSNTGAPSPTATTSGEPAPSTTAPVPTPSTTVPAPTASVTGPAAATPTPTGSSSAPAPTAAPPATGSPGCAPAGATWDLRWNPQASRDGLGAFEGVEDDRANSDPAGKPHIFVDGNNYKFTMSMKERDGADRQRNEVKGWVAGGEPLILSDGETWRVSYSMYVPSSLQATTTFTHIMQLKMPGSGTSPILVMSLRRHGSTPMIEMKVFSTNTQIGATELTPLQDKWVQTDVDFTIGEGTGGCVHWALREGGRTVLDATRNGVDTFIGDRVRWKAGIYRSIEDTSGSLQDTYLLLTDLKAYRLAG